jgi:hypothetical protein
MAISPTQLNQVFKQEVNDFEKKIDALLDKKTLAPGDSIILQVPRGMTEKHFDALKPRYISAGWKELKWNSFYDQRDNDSYISIEFKS